MQWKVLQTNVTHVELCWQESPREKAFEDKGTQEGRSSVGEREGDF